MLACPLCGNDVTGEVARVLENIPAQDRAP